MFYHATAQCLIERIPIQRILPARNNDGRHRIADKVDQ